MVIKRGFKQGQITLFIIAGIAILIITGLFIVFKADKETIKQEKVSDNEVISVKNYVNSCLESASQAVVWDFGIYGIGTDVPVYDSIISKKEMEDFLQSKILNDFEKCIDAKTIYSMGVNLSLDSGKNISVNVFENSVSVNLKYPLVIKMEGKEERIEDFSAVLSVNLGKIYEKASALVGVLNTATGGYNISEHCSEHYPNLETNIYILGNDNQIDNKIVKFIDYSSFCIMKNKICEEYGKGVQSYVFQFRTGKNIYGECVG